MGKRSGIMFFKCWKKRTVISGCCSRSTLRLTQNVCSGTQETAIFFQIALNVHFKQARHIQYWWGCTVVQYNFLYLFPILYVSRSFFDNYKDDSKFNTHVWLKKKKTLQKMGIEGASCTIIKVLYINPWQTFFSTVKNWDLIL